MRTKSPSPPPIHTIGHSNHPMGRFLELLRGAGIAVLADVRSVPHSRRWPQFRRRDLAAALADAGIDYAYFGEALGGRPADPGCYRDGRVDYDLVAQTPAFRAGLDRLIALVADRPACILCAEKEPLDCHRTLLVARRLAERGIPVRHILADGRIEDHDEIERRLLAAAGRAAPDLFDAAPGQAGDAALARAYALRADRIGFAGRKGRGARKGHDETPP